MKLRFSILFIFLPNLLMAEISQEKTSPDENASLFEEQYLLELLDEQTKIATKTKMNADFVPGMVTVLIGEQLEQKGLQTVWDALGTVVGMESVIDNLGIPGIKVRGMGGDQGVGHIKVMLDDMDMSSSFIAHAHPVLDMPIEQVERIDIIRGAGTALYGEYAFTAVINIITKKNQKNIYTGVTKNNGRLIGGNYVWQLPQYQTSASLSLAHTQNDGSQNSFAFDSIFFNPTKLDTSPTQLSKLPSISSEKQDYHSALFNLNIKDYQFKFNWFKNTHSSPNNPLSGTAFTQDNHKLLTQDFLDTELTRTFQLSKHIKVKTDFNWSQANYDSDFSLFPPPPGLIVGQGDLFTNQVSYQIEKQNADIDLFFNQWDKHSLLFAFNYATTQVKKSKQTQEFPIVRANQRREQFSLVLQDEYQPFNPLMITFGARYDAYNDIGSNISPRLAAVYQINKHHIIKSQYAEGYRPPTFLELAPAPPSSIKPQINKTIDIGYLYKKFNTSFALTSYYSRIYNVVLNDPKLTVPVANNKIEYKGIEFESKLQYSHQFGLSFNLAYGKTKDIALQKSLPLSTNFLSNLDFHYHMNNQVDYSLRYQYIGQKSRVPMDPRDKLDAANLVHFNARFKDFLSKGTSIQLGVNNLFNEKAYPHNERYWWLRLKYSL